MSTKIYFIRTLLLLIIISGCCFSQVNAKQGEARDLFRKLDSEETETLLKKGIESLGNNSLDSAFVCFSIVKSRTSNFNDSYLKAKHVCALDGLGIVSFLFGNYSTAFQMFSKAIELDPEYTQGYMNLANVYQMFGENEAVRNNLLKAYNSYLKKGESDNMSIALSDILENDIINGETSKSFSLANNFLKLDFDEKSPQLLYTRNLALGLIELNNGNPHKAVEYFLHSKKIIDNEPLYMNSRFQTITSACIASAWYAAGEIDSAVNNMRRSYNYSIKFNHPDLTIKSGKILGRYFDKLNCKDSAIYYKYCALAAADSVNSYSEYGKIKSFEMQKDVDDALKTAEKYKTENRIRNVIIICMLLVLLLLIGGFIWMRANKKRIHIKDIHIYKALNEATAKSEYFSHSQQPNPNVASSNDTDNKQKKIYNNNIEESVANALASKINDFINSNESWIRSKFTLADMAEAVGDSQRNVSQVINDKFGKNFSSYINEHRIKASIKYMKEHPESLNYTVDTIANQFGFSNRSYFTRVFQSVIGMSPAAWMKIARERAV